MTREGYLMVEQLNCSSNVYFKINVPSFNHVIFIGHDGTGGRRMVRNSYASHIQIAIRWEAMFRPRRKKKPIFGLDWAKTIVSPILRQAFISIGMEGLIL